MLMVVGPTCHLLSLVPMPTLRTCDRRLSTLTNYHSFFFFFFPISMIQIQTIKVVDLVQSTVTNSSQVKLKTVPALLRPPSHMPALRFSTQLSTPILFKSTQRQFSNLTPSKSLNYVKLEHYQTKYIIKSISSQFGLNDWSQLSIN